MARYQLRRPSPVKIVPRRVRRQVPIASNAPAPAASEAPEAEEPEEEEDEGPESPDSPFSSPSTLGGSSESEDSESDDDEEQALLPGQSGGNNASSIPSITSAVQSGAWTSAEPDFTMSFSFPENFAGAPQVTGSSTLATRSAAMTPTANPAAAGPAQSEITGKDNGPQRSSPQEEKTMITKGGAAAAITLSILSAMAVFIAAVIYIKRRKRLNNQYNQHLADGAFNSDNTGSLHVPETAHVPPASPAFDGLGGFSGSHLTRSSERSESLFGAGPYVRPETVSTDRNKSTFPIAPPQPTPNPFADPPLNKAYDVLAGRPRSTTLTDRGSWVKNPFSNPESERFDPFGELQKKARDERRKYLEESAREREVQSRYGEKEKMGLGVPERKGSGVTIQGVGLLDRSGGRR